jgi:hypothetical protein
MLYTRGSTRKMPVIFVIIELKGLIAPNLPIGRAPGHALHNRNLGSAAKRSLSPSDFPENGRVERATSDPSRTRTHAPTCQVHTGEC